MFEVTVTGVFAAAHQLRFSGGRVEPLHGHNWPVTATYAGEALDDCGLLVDFTRLQPVLNQILAELHDRNLNELPQFSRVNPSAENVARHIAQQLEERFPTKPPRRLVSVEVGEAPGCSARYRPDPAAPPHG